MNNRLLRWGAVLWVAAIGLVVYYRSNSAEIDAWIATQIEDFRRAEIGRAAEADRAEKARLKEKEGTQSVQAPQDEARDAAREKHNGFADSPDGNCMVVPQTIQRLLTGDCNDRNDGRGRCVERNGELFWCCADEDYAEFDYEAGILRCTTGRDSPAPSQTSPDTTAPPNFNSRDEAARPLPETPDATYCLNVIQRAKAKSGSRWMQSISVFDANRCRREVSAQRRHDGF